MDAILFSSTTSTLSDIDVQLADVTTPADDGIDMGDNSSLLIGVSFTSAMTSIDSDGVCVCCMVGVDCRLAAKQDMKK